MRLQTIAILFFFAAAATGCNKDSGESSEGRGVYSLSSVEGPDKVKALITNDFLKWINDPVIVEAIKKANAKNEKRSMDEIKAADQEWIKAEGISDLMREMLTNDAAQFLKKKQKESDGKYSEIFVMDFQGCNVAMSAKTSDFWQGDEAKFIKSYNDGKGAVFVDKVKFDESTKVPQVQVSLPVLDGNKVIGAITIGVSLDNLQ
ncbi:MAG TPA: hypothetical protein PKN93_20110 [Leptospiraceae bacterium]|nr:hypothetical protein [Leptospiraceae bacterium]HNN76965.1 hypothetical protein [Leptospiraceae bacterium]